MRPRLRNKKLLLFSLAMLVVVGVLTYATTLFATVYNQMDLLSRYIESLPNIVDERGGKLTAQYQAYCEDSFVRASLCATLYERDDGLGEQERLQLSKEGINALDVMLVDDDGNVIAAAEGPDALEEKIPGASKLYGQSMVRQVLQGESSLFDPNMLLEDELLEDELSGDEGEEEAPLPLIVYAVANGSNRLLVLLDYTAIGETLASYGSWGVVMERLLSGLDGYAFCVSDDTFEGYPLDSFSDEEKERVEKGLRWQLTHGSSLTAMDQDDLDSKYGTITLMGKLYFAVSLLMPSDASNSHVVIAIPTGDIMVSTYLCDIALVALVACGMVLFVRFSRQTMSLARPGEGDAPKARTKALRRHTRVGLVFVCGATAVVCVMVFMLEGMATTARMAMNQRDAIRYESDYAIQQQRATMDEYSARYTTRANALARLLSTNPGLRTRDALVSLSDGVGAKYLMLFDKDGKELVASNSYTGFLVTDDQNNPMSAYLPVLRGYDYVETEPAKNAVTGEYEHGVASLITNDQGLADGFLLLVANDDDIMSQMGDVSLEGSVNSFVAQEGQIVAVVSEEDGTFAASTDSSMIGEQAANHVDESVVGRDFEGFTWYDGDYVYVSGASSDNKTTMVIARSDASSTAFVESCILIALYSAVFCLVFFPVATRLIAREKTDAALASAHDTARRKSAQRKSAQRGFQQRNHAQQRPRTARTFFYGYVVYLAGLACFALAASKFLGWIAFDFVFGQRWTRGIHLFSLWTSLFAFAVALTGVFAIRLLLERAERNVGAQTRTFVRLADSLLTYATVILLAVYIMSLFGVDTTAMLASAGIASIALGMGAKDLITDILAGLFIIFEGSIHVGDIVEIGQWRGVVTDMGVRTTEITNGKNDVMVITNSRISEVVNMSRAKTLCTEEFDMPRSVDASEVPAIFEGYVAQVAEEVPELRSSLAYEGIVQVSQKSYTVRVSYSCNEADREVLTFRLRTAMQLLIEAEPAAS